MVTRPPRPPSRPHRRAPPPRRALQSGPEDPLSSPPDDTDLTRPAVITALRERLSGTTSPDARPGRYTELDVLGEGAFGRVIRVFDHDLEREIALKVLKPRPGAESQDVERFIEEAQAAAQLEHPNIVPIHDIARAADDQLYYTMKLVKGRTLEQLLSEQRRLERGTAELMTLTSLIQIFLQVCQAIGYAHSKGVLHRDLKPANIMLGDFGEVIVTDWGLAKILSISELPREGSASRTLEGTILGSPAYMSPEQASGEAGKIDHRSDIWSLGVLLYEMLTLCLPFPQENAAWMLANILMADPEPPRKRAPHRDIPVELERICLQALTKDRDTRYQAVSLLHHDVQGWLATERERGRRAALADAKAAEGARGLDEYRRLQHDVRELEAEIAKHRARCKPWQPREDKRQLYRKTREREGTIELLDRRFGDTIGLFTTAIGLDVDNRAAREALAELYWEKFREAEATRDSRGAAYFRPLVELYHGGKYSRELDGHGALDLGSSPPGAEVWLFEYVEEDYCLAPKNGRSLGITPIKDLRLPMGSYLLVLKKDGCRDTRYPVHISRNRHWGGTVRLHTDADIGGGFLHVAAGPFIRGGDPEALGAELPREEMFLDDFFIAEYPVTMAEYVEYLNDLARHSRDEAVKRSPRRYVEGGSFLVCRADGTFELPAVDSEGDVWHPHWPAAGISSFDALAYCEWRSGRDGRPYRLPTEPEWEKAARGVDGRTFPWGDRWDPSLCNMRDSKRERSGPEPVDSFPTDTSVYGVRGMGGNVTDWTAGEERSGQGSTMRGYGIIRGGGWNFPASYSRCAFRAWASPTLVDGRIGFRIATSAPATGDRGPAGHAPRST